MDQKDPTETSEPTKGDGIIIVDDDTTMLMALGKALEGNGHKKVDTFDDSEAAWAELEKKNYECIILDWKMPKLNGLIFLNRLRRLEQYAFTPVLIVSGFITSKDFRLLEDFPFTQMVEKPFNPMLLNYKIKELAKSRAWFEAERKQLEVVVGSFTKEDSEENLAKVVALFEKSPKSAPLAMSVCRILNQKSMYEAAEKILRIELKKDPDSTLILNELGKTLLRLGKMKEASGILQRALKQSPDNLERLCLLGEVSLQSLDPDQAQTYFKKALDIDKEDEGAHAGVTLSNNIVEFMGRSSVGSLPSTFAGLMNAIGISMVKSGEFDTGMEHYRSAMLYVTEKEQKAKLSYNVGLGYMRWRKPTEALAWFEKAVAIGGDSVEKAKGYVEKIRASNPKVAEKRFEESMAEIEKIMGDVEHSIDVPEITDEGVLPQAAAPAEKTSESTPASEKAAPAKTGAPAEKVASKGKIFQVAEKKRKDGKIITMDDKKSKSTSSDAAPPAAPKVDYVLTGDESQLFDNLKKTVFSQLRFPDESLITKVGLPKLRNSHSAFPAKLDLFTLAVIVPKAIYPATVANLPLNDVVEKIMVFKSHGPGNWEKIWPPASAAPPAKMKPTA